MSFQPHHISRLGNRFAVPINPAKDGYVGRECPNPECEEYFKVTPGTGIKGPAPCHCPCCGHTGDSNTFWTRDQIEYARSVVRQKFIDAVRRDLKSMEFEHKPKGVFGIGIRMKLKPGAPVPLRWYREKNLETELVCDQCGLRYAIYGVFGWCPDCKVHNSLQILSKNLELAHKKLALAEAMPELAETIVADTMAGVIAAFDGFGREVCSEGEPKASFQNLEGGRRRVVQRWGFDIAGSVSTDEWQSACRCFQKRHLLAHRLGVIDEEYVLKASDPAAVVGRKVMLSSGEVAGLILTVEKLGRRIYEGILEAKKSAGPGTDV